MWTYISKTDTYEFKVHTSIDLPLTIESITYEDNDELALKSEIEELKTENAELKLQIATINNKIDNLVSKDTLTNLLVNSTMELVNHNQATINYPSEAVKYLHLAKFEYNKFNIFFNNAEYPNAKYILFSNYYYSQYTDGGYVAFYDFTTMKGTLMMFAKNTHSYRYETINSKIYYDELQLYGTINPPFIEGTDLIWMQDEEFMEDDPDYIKFFKVIEKSNEEEELKQLYGALMKCGNIMQLQK